MSLVVFARVDTVVPCSEARRIVSRFMGQPKGRRAESPKDLALQLCATVHREEGITVPDAVVNGVHALLVDAITLPNGADGARIKWDYVGGNRAHYRPI